MDKLRVVPYRPEHCLEHEAQAKQGPCSSILLGDEVLAMGGIMIPWIGLGILWFDLRPAGKARIRQIWPLCVQAVKDWVGQYRFVRLEAHCDSGDPQAIRTAWHLGFRSESTMRRWGPGGRDHEMMVIVQ